MSAKQGMRNLQKMWRGKSPIGRIVIISMALVPFIVISIGISSLFSSNDSDTVDSKELESSVTAPKEKGNASKEAQDVIIRNIKDQKTAELVEKTAKAKVLQSARSGQSGFMELTERSHDKEANPFKKEVPTQENIIAKKKPVQRQETIKREPRERRAPVEVNNEPVLDSNTVKELEAPLEETKPKRVTASSADIYDANELRADPMAGLDSERYTRLLEQKKRQIQKGLAEAFKNYNKEKSSQSKGYVAYAEPEQTQSSDSSFSGSNRQRNDFNQRKSSANTGNAEKEKPPMLLMPNETIVASNPYPIDNRIKQPFILDVPTGLLAGAKIRCSYSDNGDFLVPKCNEITYKNESLGIPGGTGKMEAIAINPDTMDGIVDQDIDNDLLFKTLARVGATGFSIWGTNKLEQGKTVTEDADTNRTTTEYDLSDEEIALAALGTSIGDFQSAAERYYQQASVKTIPRDTTIILVMTRPMPDWWGLKAKLEGNTYDNW